MKEKHISIQDDVMDVLRRSTITGNVLVLPRQLDRALYVATNKILEASGGKWNKKHQGHLFESDPTDVLGLAMENGKVLNHKQTYQFFSTPPEIVNRMILLANLDNGMRVLEPSAGTGSIIRGIKSTTRAHVTAIDIDPEKVKGLRKENLCEMEYAGDFLVDFDRKFLGDFDRILMNPPFTGGQDIKHIEHARQFLKPGGRIVAISSASTKARSYLESVASHTEEVEAGAFKESGTSILTLLSVIE